MTYSGDSSTFVPSHLRAISPGEQWIVDRTAETFLETGGWPKWDRLVRDAARANIELPEVVFGVPIQDFVWRPDSQGTVVLSVPGFWRSSVGKEFVEKFLQVVLLCRDTYLGEDDEEDDEHPKITSEDLRSKLGFDDTTIARVHTELPFEYFLTGGGGATSETEWYCFINQTVAKFRGVRSVDEYFEERTKIVAPRFPVTPWPPTVPDIEGTTFLEPPASAEYTPEDGPIVDPRMVFVVHGRDSKARDAMWTFLESLGLHPLDWNEMVRRTGKGTPHTLRVVEAGFTMAKVFVVLMTPDDEARLHVDLQEPNDPPDEINLTCQPRPNVMFEAGRAFGTQPDRTIIVQVGRLRRVSDLEGLNVVRIGTTKAPLMALADRLEAAGCPINRKDLDLFDPARFGNLASHDRRASEAETPQPSGPHVGRVLSSAKRAAPTPRLSVKLWDQGNHNHLLEIANRGGVALEDVEWELPEEVHNWAIASSILPQYPIPRLAPEKYVRMPVSISIGGPAYVDLTVRARTESGLPYETVEQLSIYG